MSAGASETSRLLDELERHFRRFLVLTDHQVHALCAWVMHTYCYEVGEFTPYLIVTSAEKRSGKTRLIESLRYVVHRPRTYSSPTAAALYRAVSQLKPTLMIDETDALFNDSSRGPSESQEAMRGIINNGFETGMLIPRIMPNGELMEFSTFGPKVLAGIGHLPETIEDRGLPIRLVRKDVATKVERMRKRTVTEETRKLRDDLEGWGAYALINLGTTYPDMPEGLDDRGQDIYEILVMIGDHAGDPWGQRIRDALVVLRTGHEQVEKSPGIRLLEDLSLIDLSGREMIQTSELLALLYAEGEQPYEDWWGDSSGKKAALRLSKLLSEYGVKPMQYRDGTAKRRGYVAAEITREVARYAHSDGTHGTSLQIATFQHGTGSSFVPSTNVPICREVPCVPSQNPGSPARGSVEWLAQASMDELREFYDSPDTP